MKIDFHVHTKFSPDSIIQLRDLAAKAGKLGIVPAITDHNSISAHPLMRSIGARFIPGEEIFTERGDLIGLYLTELIPEGTGFLEAIDMIHGQGGIAYLPHMYDRGRSGAYAGEKEAARVDIVEVFNARCLKQEYNDHALNFAKGNNLLQAAGSDSHFLLEFGSTYTNVPDFDVENPKELLKALKRAKLTTKKAPFYVRGTTTLVHMTKRLTGRNSRQEDF